jgi:succinyl-CoA synthetase alpha subunit
MLKVTEIAFSCSCPFSLNPTRRFSSKASPAASARNRHAQLSIDYGTQVVAGVTPGKGGQVFEHGGKKVPIFDTVADAVKQTGATASAVFRAAALRRRCDSRGRGCRTGTRRRHHRRHSRARHGSREARLQGNTKTRLIGPNCPGLVTPGEGKDSHGGCRIGIAPGYIHKKGNIGVVSRSGTLTYEAVWQLTSRGVGQSTCVGIGGDPVNGTSHLDVIKLFNDDPETHGIIMIGEIGGSAEEEAAEWIKKNCKKPVAGFIAGATAPPGRRMGHAGAIVSGGKGTAEAKIAAFKAAGIGIAVTPSEMADTLLKMM